MKEIGFDKVKHFFASLVGVVLLSLMFKGLATWYSAEQIPNFAIGGMATIFMLLVGGAKEAVDWREKGFFDKGDMIADLCGCVLAFIMTLLM